MRTVLATILALVLFVLGWIAGALVCYIFGNTMDGSTLWGAIPWLFGPGIGAWVAAKFTHKYFAELSPAWYFAFIGIVATLATIGFVFSIAIAMRAGGITDWLRFLGYIGQLVSFGIGAKIGWEEIRPSESRWSGTIHHT